MKGSALPPRSANASAASAVRNRVLFTLCALALAAFAATGFLSSAPNRLADGTALLLWQLPAGRAGPVLALVAVLGVLSLLRCSRTIDRAELLVAALLALALLVTAGLSAKLSMVPDHPAQRLALGPAFWLGLASAALAMLDAMQRLRLGLLARVGSLVLGVGIFAALGSLGIFDALSLTRELASHRNLFVAALLHHVVLVAAALGLSIIICAPLIVLVRRYRHQAAWIYAVLGLVQTIPSIALFGLLIAPLSALASRVPFLKSLGLSGLGTTPALIALVLYAAFPLVRTSDAAFSAVAPAVADAARGLGFGRRQRFFAVDLPLALPVLLSGLRVVSLQAIGLATVAALIGGGGLGTFIFEGIGEYALDLVLVGALPVILLALMVDFAFRVGEAAAETSA